MRQLACLAALSFALTAIAACAPVEEDEGATSTDALTALTAAQCETPAVHTSPKKNGSREIAGSAHTTLAGCIVGAPGETGEALVTRLAALVGNTARLGTVKDEKGAAVFDKFKPGARKGTLETSLTQDIDVTLAMSHAPRTKLRTTQHQASSGAFSLSIVNATPVDAAVALFTVTVVKPGNLSLTLEVTAQSNGITVTGASDIVLEQQKDQAAGASVLVSDIFRWLTTELAKAD